MPQSPPQLACVVISLAGQETVVDAVRSLLAQDEPIEVVVVNSNGNDPTMALRAAGFNGQIISLEERLFAGGARNLGIAATSAPYVSFLAADCTAEPGWASGRLDRHKAGALAVSCAVTNAHPGSIIAWTSHIMLHARRMPGIPIKAHLDYGISYARTLFDRYGLFRDDMRTGEDTDYNRRLAHVVTVVWASEVRCAHQTPTTLPALIRDQFGRGRRRVQAQRQMKAHAPARLTGIRSLNVIRHFRWAWIAADNWRDRRYVLAALIFAPPGWLAYNLGVLLSNWMPTETTAAASSGKRSRPRLLALLQFHNEMRYLPGYFENVAPQVDGIIALDDGSTDGSGDFVAEQPSVLELIRLPPREPHVWNEPENRRLLLEAAGRHAPDWLLAVDADERLERQFGDRAKQAMERAAKKGFPAYRVRLRELWDHPAQYRVDGIWGRKFRSRLFRWRADFGLDTRALHGEWIPRPKRFHRRYPKIELAIYHLKMVNRADRVRRQQFYQILDPQRQWQQRGYDYLTDERGLRLEQITPGREYESFEGLSEKYKPDT